MWLYLHLREQFKHSIFIYFESPRIGCQAMGQVPLSAKPSCQLEQELQSPEKVHRQWHKDWRWSLVAEGFSGMHETLSLISYVTNTYIKAMIPPPLAQQPRAFWSLKSLSKKGTELWKWLVLRLGKDNTNGISKILYQNGKEVLKERSEHVQRKGLPKG